MEFLQAKCVFMIFPEIKDLNGPCLLYIYNYENYMMYSVY